ncbi:hypothetical protein JST97_07740 [bacterium]|nr:hypothetical protein [bacterium]
MRSLLLLLLLSGQVWSQTSLEENLSLNLEGQYEVRRVQAGGDFAPIRLSNGGQQHVTLVWQSAPIFQVVCTNGLGWSVTLRAPAHLQGPGGASLPLDYEYGSGRVSTLAGSDPVETQDSHLSGDLSMGAKTVSVAADHRGGYRYQIGNFFVPTLGAQMPAGRYGGEGLLVTTFSNTP